MFEELDPECRPFQLPSEKVLCFIEARHGWNGGRPKGSWSCSPRVFRVTELLMATYMSAEREKTIAFQAPDLESFVPAVTRGEWNSAKQ